MRIRGRKRARHKKSAQSACYNIDRTVGDPDINYDSKTAEQHKRFVERANTGYRKKTARESSVMEKRQGHINRRSERIADARNNRTKFREEFRARQDQRIAGRRERIKAKYIKGDAGKIKRFLERTARFDKFLARRRKHIDDRIEQRRQRLDRKLEAHEDFVQNLYQETKIRDKNRLKRIEEDKTNANLKKFIKRSAIGAAALVLLIALIEICIPGSFLKSRGIIDDTPVDEAIMLVMEEEIPAEKQYNTLNGITEEQLLWDLLMEHFDGNEIATLGVMCNLKSESRFEAGNLEDYNNQIWEIEDLEYTEKINRHTIDKQDFLEARLLDTTNGFYNKYGEWVNIDGGYGYGQYTSYAKKEGLYHFAEVWFGPGGPGEEYKFNIADPEMQAHYVVSILESDEFKSLDKQIRSSKKVVDACYLWLKMYEIPQDPYCDNYFTLSFERASNADAIREACLNRESVSDNEAEPETVNGTNLDLGDSTSGAGLNN